MTKKTIYQLIFLVLCLSGYSSQPDLHSYPHFYDHPYLDNQMRAGTAPYLLPLDHPMKDTLDFIFSQSRVLENEKTLVDAGFTIIAGPMPASYAIVARHPWIPGYVFKLYLDSETRCRDETPHWAWLARRCSGARGIRKIIRRDHIRFFTVPDKWLYIVPPYPNANVLKPESVILMATDMQPESIEVTKHMWKTAITRKHLDELYLILKYGYGGQGVLCLHINVPFTKQGKFAFTDTDEPRAQLKLKYVKRYLSKEMQHYWDHLIHNKNS